MGKTKDTLCEAELIMFALKEGERKPTPKQIEEEEESRKRERERTLSTLVLRLLNQWLQPIEPVLGNKRIEGFNHHASWMLLFIPTKCYKAM